MHLFLHSCLALLLLVPALALADSAQLVAAAEAQLGVTTSYDPSYRRLDYPMGDVPMHTGVCTDVVIRAYRELGIDLQRRVHEDMRAAFDDYPRLWGLHKPDRNIDHRRVPNLQTFFRRHAAELTVTQQPASYLPGDLVTWRLPGNLPHIGIVSAERTADGEPLILHNIGFGVRKEAILFAYPITGHYRFYPQPAGPTPAISD
ncbi:DUF1287 domain-containing protein [Pseudomarimonas arenosa]|uniref:DUF1287 domain-containing protein n=1 Tax=Pseudomarimonas arenosa TaxID=2774145 RepID=A0AAW3ZMY2_9GAMM|nr:DUF1287 domain-containing protein [Pseudomarimonas arenosa]